MREERLQRCQEAEQTQAEGEREAEKYENFGAFLVKLLHDLHRHTLNFSDHLIY